MHGDCLVAASMPCVTIAMNPKQVVMNPYKKKTHQSSTKKGSCPDASLEQPVKRRIVNPYKRKQPLLSTVHGPGIGSNHNAGPTGSSSLRVERCNPFQQKAKSPSVSSVPIRNPYRKSKHTASRVLLSTGATAVAVPVRNPYKKRLATKLPTIMDEKVSSSCVLVSSEPIAVENLANDSLHDDDEEAALGVSLPTIASQQCSVPPKSCASQPVNNTNAFVIDKSKECLDSNILLEPSRLIQPSSPDCGIVSTKAKTPLTASPRELQIPSTISVASSSTTLSNNAAAGLLTQLVQEECDSFWEAEEQQRLASHLMDMRRLLERTVTQLITRRRRRRRQDGSSRRERRTLFCQIEWLRQERIVSRGFAECMHQIRTMGNCAAHIGKPLPDRDHVEAAFQRFREFRQRHYY